MRITSEMIIDYLNHRGYSTAKNMRTSRSFTGLRLYYPGVDIDKDVLYFCSDLQILQEEIMECCVLLPINIETATIEWIHDWITCICDKNILFNLLQDCFSLFNEWYAGATDLVFGRCRIQELIEFCVEVIPNPIIVDDPKFRNLAFSKGSGDGLSDYESVFLSKNRYHSPKYIKKVTSNPVFLNNLKGSKYPFIYHYDFLPNPSIYCPIHVDDKLAGFLTIVGSFQKPTAGMADLAGILVQLLSACLQATDYSHLFNSPQEYLLLEVLHGNQANAEIACFALDKMNIAPDNIYYIVMGGFTSVSQQDFTSEQQLFYLLKDIAPGIIFLKDYEYAVLIIRKHIAPANLVVEKLMRLCKLHKLRFSISSYFTGTPDIKYFYRQAKSIMNLAFKLSPSESKVFRYQEFIFEDMILMNEDMSEMIAIKHPALDKLEQHDKLNKTCYKQTLETYLKRGSNPSAAANDLHIHKNSLYYRITRITELTGIDLSDYDELNHLSVSFAIERLQIVAEK